MSKIQDQATRRGRVGNRVLVPLEDGSLATVTGLGDEEMWAIAADFEARGYVVKRTPAP